MENTHISWIDTLCHEVHPIIKIGTTSSGDYYAATPKVRGFPSFCIGPHDHKTLLEEIENINNFYNANKSSPSSTVE